MHRPAAPSLSFDLRPIERASLNPERQRSRTSPSREQKLVAGFSCCSPLEIHDFGYFAIWRPWRDVFYSWCAMVAFDEGVTVRMLTAPCSVLYYAEKSDRLCGCTNPFYLRRNRAEERK